MSELADCVLVQLQSADDHCDQQCPTVFLVYQDSDRFSDNITIRKSTIRTKRLVGLLYYLSNNVNKVQHGLGDRYFGFTCCRLVGVARMTKTIVPAKNVAQQMI